MTATTVPKTLVISAFVQVQTVVTGKMLHPGRQVHFNMMMGKEISHNITTKTDDEIKAVLKEIVIASQTNAFLALMKTDSSVKHHVGSVRWKIAVLDLSYEFQE